MVRASPSRLNAAGYGSTSPELTCDLRKLALICLRETPAAAEPGYASQITTDRSA
jgi:hypothetical protein